MHFYLLENPAAGRGRARLYLEGVSRELVALGHRVTTYRGRSAEDLSAQVRSLAGEAIDVLVVVGGDGTLRTVVNADEGLPPWPIGVVPVGTANLVAREVRTWPRSDPADLARRLQGGTPWRTDLLEIHREAERTERVLAIVGAGVDAALVQAVMRARAGDGGRGGYGRWVGPALGVLRGFASDALEVSVDGAPPRTCAAAMVQNALCYGGLFRLSPDARLDSGRAEVVLIRARTPRDLLRLAWQAGVRRVHRDRQVRILAGRRVRIAAREPQAVQADGDPAGQTDVEVVVRPGAIRLWRT